MKNFPHQVNQIPRLVGGLKVFRDLANAGRDLSSDSGVGDALISAGVYTFRGAPSDATADQLSAYVAAEHAKPAASRGSQTFARELRRTYELLGFIRRAGKGWSVTETGQAIVDSRAEPDQESAKVIWRTALHGLELTSDEGTSNPYEILLRLAGERPGLPRKLLGLALEARDNSEEEFERLLAIIDAEDPDEVWGLSGTSKSQRDNSSKILPGLALQLGELTLTDGGVVQALQAPNTERGQTERRDVVAVGARRRTYLGDRTASPRPIPEASTRYYDPALLAKRYEDHEVCLEAFVSRLTVTAELWEGTYDLCIDLPEEKLLIEVKTIRADAPAQVRRAVGQLLEYEYFDVEPEWPGSAVTKLLVVDRPISDELAAFLERHEVGLVTMNGCSPPVISERARSALNGRFKVG